MDILRKMSKTLVLFLFCGYNNRRNKEIGGVRVMSFIDEIKQRAKQDIKTIVLPESDDIRVINGAAIALNEAYADIVLVGNKEKVSKLAEENGVDISKAKIVDPELSDKLAVMQMHFMNLEKQRE